MAVNEQATARRTFRHFFLRGLAILLPTILTLWLFITSYRFVRDNIAEPINTGLRWALIEWSPIPELSKSERDQIAGDMSVEDEIAWLGAKDSSGWFLNHSRDVRRQKLQQKWETYGIALDLIGLIVAIVVIYFVGRFVGSYIGSRLYWRGEDLLRRMPVIRQVYPYVKQVTDFVVGSEQGKLQFKRVVAVEYPRKGLWAVGLVTGDAMSTLQAKSSTELVTIFVPSSPTPFTGYVITVPAEETVNLNLTIDQALKFTISGGVLTPSTESTKGGVVQTNDQLPENAAG